MSNEDFDLTPHPSAEYDGGSLCLDCGSPCGVDESGRCHSCARSIMTAAPKKPLTEHDRRINQLFRGGFPLSPYSGTLES